MTNAHSAATPSSSHKVPELVYYDVAGRAESIRLAFHVAGKDFQDTRFAFDKVEDFRSRTPTGMFPILQVGDKVYVESHAILCYVCGLNHMLPKTAEDWLLSMQAVECCEDILKKQWDYCFTPKADTEEGKKKEKDEAQAEARRFLKHLEQACGKNEKFYVGDHYTPADFMLTSTFEMLINSEDPIFISKDLSKEFPKIDKIAHGVRAAATLHHKKHEKKETAAAPAAEAADDEFKSKREKKE